MDVASSGFTRSLWQKRNRLTACEGDTTLRKEADVHFLSSCPFWV